MQKNLNHGKSPWIFVEWIREIFHQSMIVNKILKLPFYAFFSKLFFFIALIMGYLMRDQMKSTQILSQAKLAGWGPFVSSIFANCSWNVSSLICVNVCWCEWMKVKGGHTFESQGNSRKTTKKEKDFFSRSQQYFIQVLIFSAV